MLVSMSVDIEAAPEKVWLFLVEPEKTMEWFTMLKKFEFTSDPPYRVGTTFYWYEEAASCTYNLYFETTEWVENEVFGYRMVRGDFSKSCDERLEIEKTPSGCRFTFNDHIEFPYGPIGRIIGWSAARNARKSGDEILANLKKLAEA